MVLERFELFCTKWNEVKYKWCVINGITIYQDDDFSFSISTCGVTDYLDLRTKIGTIIFSVALKDITYFRATLKSGEEK